MVKPLEIGKKIAENRGATMTKRPRRNHSPAFMHVELLGAFTEDRRRAKADAAPAVDVRVLHAKIGELTLANDFLAGALGKAGLLASARR